jgi:hypothetical protein
MNYIFDKQQNNQQIEFSSEQQTRIDKRLAQSRIQQAIQTICQKQLETNQAQISLETFRDVVGGYSVGQAVSKEYKLDNELLYDAMTDRDIYTVETLYKKYTRTYKELNPNQVATQTQTKLKQTRKSTQELLEEQNANQLRLKEIQDQTNSLYEYTLGILDAVQESDEYCNKTFGIEKSKAFEGVDLQLDQEYYEGLNQIPKTNKNQVHKQVLAKLTPQQKQDLGLEKTKNNGELPIDKLVPKKKAKIEKHQNLEIPKIPEEFFEDTVAWLEDNKPSFIKLKHENNRAIKDKARDVKLLEPYRNNPTQKPNSIAMTKFESFWSMDNNYLTESYLYILVASTLRCMGLENLPIDKERQFPIWKKMRTQIPRHIKEREAKLVEEINNL